MYTRRSKHDGEFNETITLLDDVGFFFVFFYVNLIKLKKFGLEKNNKGNGNLGRVW